MFIMFKKIMDKIKRNNNNNDNKIKINIHKYFGVSYYNMCSFKTGRKMQIVYYTYIYKFLYIFIFHIENYKILLHNIHV